MTKRYQRVIRNRILKNDRQVQWPKDTIGVIRNRMSKNDRQYNDQKIPKGVTRSRMSKKEDRQYNGQKKKHKTEKKIHTFEYVEILILVYVCPKYTTT